MRYFSEHEPGHDGPRRVTQSEVLVTFHEGWEINNIRAARFESNMHMSGAQAWLSFIKLLPASQNDD